MNETNVLIFSLLGGIVPALFWLWFWIKEDKLRPEPKSALLIAFIGGMLAVTLALFFELIIYYLLVDANPYIIDNFPNILKEFLENIATQYNLIDRQADFWLIIKNFFSNQDFFSDYNIDFKKAFLVVIVAPIIEEFLKLFFTYNICLRRKINDEPIDASIYMLTTALGFAALETTLFLIDSFGHNSIIGSLAAGNFRSIGPMLIHLISSATLGLFIGLAFYKSKIKKFLYLLLGLGVAIILHALFNLFIILSDITNNITFFWIACLGAWTLIIALLIFFRKIKKVFQPISKNPRKI